MDFSGQLDDLQQRAAKAKQAAQAAATASVMRPQPGE